MPIRQFLNLAYADLVVLVGATDTEDLDAWLCEKFESEMTPQEKRKLEMQRMSKQMGEAQGVRDLMGAFGMAR